jgi:hypothetical protein
VPVVFVVFVVLAVLAAFFAFFVMAESSQQAGRPTSGGDGTYRWDSATTCGRMGPCDALPCC